MRKICYYYYCSLHASIEHGTPWRRSRYANHPVTLEYLKLRATQAYFKVSRHASRKYFYRDVKRRWTSPQERKPKAFSACYVERSWEATGAGGAENNANIEYMSTNNNGNSEKIVRRIYLRSVSARE